MGEVVNTSNPTLVWANRDPDVFYYEVQASKDPAFNTDPQTATASDLARWGKPNEAVLPKEEDLIPAA